MNRAASISLWERKHNGARLKLQYEIQPLLKFLIAQNKMKTYREGKQSFIYKNSSQKQPPLLNHSRCTNYLKFDQRPT